MRLARILIRNFKTAPANGTELLLDNDVTVLVGRNNTGKSTILEALQIILGSKNPRYAQFDTTAFNDPAHPIVIEAEFVDLTFGTGRTIGLSQAQCHALMQASSKKTERFPGHLTLRLTVPREDTSDNDEDDEEGSERSLVILLGNRSEVKRTEALRKSLAQIVPVPPVRNHTDLLSGSTWTAYGRLMRELLRGSPEAGDLRRLIDDATAKVRAILRKQADALATAAQLTSYVDTVDFRLTKEGDPAELLRNLSIEIGSAGRIDDISNVGTGTQSVIILAMLELCLRHKAGPGVRLFCVEEPELFLHPHAQRYVAGLMRRIGSETGTQVILTTHSGEILAGMPTRSIVRVARDVTAGTQCLHASGLAVSSNVDLEVIKRDAADMFFADRAILVEGVSEALLLPAAARLVEDNDGSHFDPDNRNVSFVAVGGKESLTRFARILSALGIEWRVIADRDSLTGDTLAYFKGLAGVDPTQGAEEQIRGLRAVGVAVLRDGEIENYYPHEVLAEIAGCALEDVAAAIEARRRVFDEPSSFELTVRLVSDFAEEIAGVAPERVEKRAKAWYDQSLSKLRSEGGIGQIDRKTGEILALWLKLPKPEIALRVAKWLEVDATRVPESLRALIRWLFASDGQ